MSEKVSIPLDLNRPQQVGKHHHLKVNDTYAIYWMEGNKFHLAHNVITHTQPFVCESAIPATWIAVKYYIHTSYWGNTFQKTITFFSNLDLI